MSDKKKYFLLTNSDKFSWTKRNILIVTLAAVTIAATCIYFVSSKKPKDSCQLDNGSDGTCVAVADCSVVVMNKDSQCESDIQKTCCPPGAIFPSLEAGRISKTPIHRETLSIEKVGERHRDSYDDRQWKFKNSGRCGIAGYFESYHNKLAQHGEFPFYVALKYRTMLENGDEGFRFLCGGSLISGKIFRFQLIFSRSNYCFQIVMC